MKHVVLISVASALLAAGCASNKSEKATLQRGWIGGEYQQAKRGLVPAGQRGALYVKQVYPGTPAELAGLQPADLILAIDGRPVEHLQALRRCLDEARPASRAALRIERSGQELELPLTIGRETYQKWHAVRMGFGFSTRVDLWPDRDFSVLSLLQYKLPNDRAELHSPEAILARRSAPSSATGKAGTRSNEGWDVWILLFGFDAHLRILSQESIAPQTAQAGSR